MEPKNDSGSSKRTIEIKQAFLSNAISDISSYIQLSDTKVSIIMASMLALIAVFASCYDPILDVLTKIKPCSWLGILLIISGILLLISLISVFAFGILTIRGHSSNINYTSKWFLPQSTKMYSFDSYRKDVLLMSDEDIIENMTAELYKLNDINRQKLNTNKWVMSSFSATLFFALVIFALLVIPAL